MTAKQRHGAAMADPENRRMIDGQWATAFFERSICPLPRQVI